MKAKTVQKNNQTVAVIESDALLIYDVQSSLDFMATVKYETDCQRIALNKEAIIEDFFVLSTGLAGEILQKFINYQVKLAIVGDFSNYHSKPLKDFIYESNQGNHIFFVSTEANAVTQLAWAK